MSGEVALRALAIATVTFNHSQQLGYSFGFGGGMSFLMMLSGFNLARFGMDGKDGEATKRAIVRLGWAIAFPTILVIILSSFIRRDFVWSELLFVSKLLRHHDVGWMYLWYPQVLIQILLLLWLAFSIPAAANLVRRYPFRCSIGLFAAGVAVRSQFPVERYANIWPPLILWNFVLGWVVYFTLSTDVVRGYLNKRLLIMACALVGAFVGWTWKMANPYFLVAATAVFVFVKSVPMPALAARLVGLVSQAAFAIFLLHVLFIKLYDHYFEQDTISKFLFTMTLSVLCWVAAAAASRAYSVRIRELSAA